MKINFYALKERLSEFGYCKRKSSFWKIEDGFYKLIDFQIGAHGNYFFINICLHPIGLPKLLTKELLIPETPGESECIIRQRIEQIIKNPVAERFTKELVSVNDMEIMKGIIDSISEIDRWLKEWGNYKKIEKVQFEDVDNMLTVVPVLKKKAFFMAKCYCAYKNGNAEIASRNLDAYSNEIVDGFSFPNIDRFLSDLLKEGDKYSDRTV